MRADIHDGQGAKTLRSMGRIQMRETNYLQIATSSLHRTAGPYKVHDPTPTPSLPELEEIPAQPC
jgi:hypothetical protein